jgi:hypothetical protein
MQVGNGVGEIEQSLTATAHLQWTMRFPVLFSVDPFSFEPSFFTQFAGRIALGSKEGLPHLLGMKTLQPDDLAIIKKISSNLLIKTSHQESAEQQILSHRFITEAKKVGFRIFRDSTSKLSYLQEIQPIEMMEFVLSEEKRLSQFPNNSVSNQILQKIMSVETVFVLALIQDFEILSPFIKQFASLGQFGGCRVVVTARVKECHLWNGISSFLTALGVRIIFAKSVLDAIGYLPQNSGVLFTASESSAAGHNFCYELCRLASPHILKVTFQHGYENVGLRHHISHNATYQKGIRFASDIIFTWTEKDKLVDAFPSELSRCIPVGVTKKQANEALILRNKLYQATVLDTAAEISIPKQSTSVLLCENLHSVRFNNVKLREAFLSVIHGLQSSPRIALKIRSHPGKRLLEKDEVFKKFSFLAGELTSETISGFDVLISPPSTIILDAVLCGVHTLVWSASQELGDLHYYDSLSTISRMNDVVEMLFQLNQNPIDSVMNNLVWAARNTTAFDGTPFVLSRIAELI